MNVQLVAFVFGGVLRFVGVLGGGFEVKELKIPKVGGGVRVLSAIVGVIFIVLGFSGSPPTAQGSEGPGGHPQVVLANTNHDPVEFFLTDQLGDDEVSEQVTVLIDGKDVGDLTVNQNYPNSKIRVSVPQTGQHSYTAEATAVFDNQGTSFEYTGVGQGMINVQYKQARSIAFAVAFPATPGW